MAERPTAPAYFAVITGPVLDDRVLSDSAKLLYGRITSMADREGFCWATNKFLSELTGYGERTISRLVAQLEERGHIWTEQVPALRAGGHERRIYIGARAAKRVATGGEAEKPGRVDKIGEGRQFCQGGIAKNGEAYIRMINKQDKIPPISPQGDGVSQNKTKTVAKWRPEQFEAFWKFYRDHARKEDRAGAVREWDRLKPDDDLIATMHRALTAQLQTPDWKRGIGIPYACRWLRNRRWEDVEPEGPVQAEPQRRYVGKRMIDGVEVDVYE